MATAYIAESEAPRLVTVRPERSVDVRDASSGDVDVRVLGEDMLALTVAHRRVGSAVVAKLLKFFESNRLSLVTIPGPDGSDYTGFFRGAYTVRQVSGDLHDATVEIVANAGSG